MTGDRIVVVGDLINDIVVLPRGEIRPYTDTPCTIRPRPGGAAANTAAWLGSLGVPTDYVGAVGSHDAADHEAWLRDQGVVAHLQVEYGVPTGMIVIVVREDSRTMLTERGANALLSSDAVSDGMLRAARIVHLGAHSFLDGDAMQGVRDLMSRARVLGVEVALNPGSAGWIADVGRDRFLEAMAGADILFPNADEGALLTGERDPERIVAALLERVPTVALTLGERGCIGGERGRPPVHLDAPRVRVVDPTGAGDAFAAGFLERRRGGGDLASSLAAASRVAARALVSIGGRPAV